MTRLYKRISMPINRDLVPFLREAKPENFAYLQRREGSFFYSEGRTGWGFTQRSQYLQTDLSHSLLLNFHFEPHFLIPWITFMKSSPLSVRKYSDLAGTVELSTFFTIRPSLSSSVIRAERILGVTPPSLRLSSLKPFSFFSPLCR